MPRGGFGGGRGFGGGGFGRGFGGGFGMRRMGRPLLGFGGWGGYGSPLMGTLMAGGLGYALGSSSAQQYPPVVQNTVVPGYPPYPYPVPAAGPGAPTGTLAQLQLLGELRDSGTLTEAEFAREKNRILGQPSS